MFGIVKQRYKDHFTDPDFRFSIPIAIAALLASVFVNYYAGTYATEKASNPVTDIILSNTPVFDVGGLFIYGTVALVVFIAFLCLSHPKRIPFILHSAALFYLIRSVFVSLTHLGPFPNVILLDLGSIMNKFIFGGDLFFSGHTGLPFLMALIFWEDVRLRYIFILASIFFGSIALLGHLHYSIDVVAAFFITYTIFRIAEKIFKRERELFYWNL